VNDEDIKPIKEFLQPLVKQLSEHQKKQSPLLSAWQKIVGTELAEKSHIVDIQHNKLIIAVSHAGIAQIISLQKDHILAKVRSMYPSIDVYAIKTVLQKNVKKPQKSHDKGASDANVVKDENDQKDSDFYALLEVFKQRAKDT
jgi:hypothetical protein